MNPASLDRITDIKIFMPQPSKAPQLVNGNGEPAEGARFNEYPLAIFHALYRAALFAVIRETHQHPSELNLLSCYITSGLDLHAGDLVILNGLVGSKLPATNHMLLQSSAGLIIGKWDNDEGVLSFFFAEAISNFDFF